MARKKFKGVAKKSHDEKVSRDIDKLFVEENRREVELEAARFADDEPHWQPEADEKSLSDEDSGHKVEYKEDSQDSINGDHLIDAASTNDDVSEYINSSDEKKVRKRKTGSLPDSEPACMASRESGSLDAMNPQFKDFAPSSFQRRDCDHARYDNEDEAAMVYDDDDDDGAAIAQSHSATSGHRDSNQISSRNPYSHGTSGTIRCCCRDSNCLKIQDIFKRLCNIDPLKYSHRVGYVTLPGTTGKNYEHPTDKQKSRNKRRTLFARYLKRVVIIWKTMVAEPLCWKVVMTNDSENKTQRKNKPAPTLTSIQIIFQTMIHPLKTLIHSCQQMPVKLKNYNINQMKLATLANMVLTLQWMRMTRTSHRRTYLN